MALSASPRKIVPLSSGDDSKRPGPAAVPTLTKSVFFCGVVVEGSEHGRKLPQDVEDLVRSLGTPLSAQEGQDTLRSNVSPSSNEPAGSDHPSQRRRAMTDTSALADVINELVTTEQSYVRRLRILKHDYADPLRKFARNKNTAIIPSYEAKILFGNIDSLLPVNEAFLTDLEKMIAPNGSKHIGGVGDVTLKHFKQLHGFEHYKFYYSKREEAQAIFERENKKSSSFLAYIDRIKYSSADVRNRVGLRELLMDPVQRIPRYTLMFRTMIKHMAPGDPQRAKLIETEEIASKIALAETDEETKRAAIMYCLSATMDGFPASLISNSRCFIDCVDVEDVEVSPSAGTSGSSSSAGTLHCTLFLFDDKLVIAKRPGSGDKAGRILAGLDETEKLAKAGGLPHGMKKSMSCKGVVDITDIVATDVGGADFNVFLETPPQDQSERWNGRPFRSYSVVLPPSPVNLDPVRTDAEKKRFLENLWTAQAKFRTKAGQSVALRDEEREVESRGGRTTLARTYYNVYTRTSFLRENRKAKIVVHIDDLGSADPIPFGVGGPPYVAVRVQPLAGELSRYTVRSSDATDENEEDIIQTARVPGRIVQTIHQYGLFKFRTRKNSMPSTPTSTRSKAAIFGLDAISRNLFTARLGTSKVDIFGGSITSHTRSKSAGSRSSMYTQSTSTGDGSLAVFSHRSNSTATAATTVSMSDEEIPTAKSPRPRKLSKPRKSKSPAISDTEASPSRSGSRSKGKAKSGSKTDGEYSDEDEGAALGHRHMNDSEWDLARRLELARKNSQIQNNKPIPPLPAGQPREDVIYEEEPPTPVRPSSRTSKGGHSHRSATPRPDSPPNRHRSNSLHSEKHIAGPRCPSPSPCISPQNRSSVELPSLVDELASEPIMQTVPPDLPTTPRRETEKSTVGGSRQLPPIPTTNVETTPKGPVVSSVAPSSVEPLSIKKKAPARTDDPPSPTSARSRQSRLTQQTPRKLSPPQISAHSKHSRVKSVSPNSTVTVIADRVLLLAQSTKHDVESSHRAVKRIKIQLDAMGPAQASNDDNLRSPGQSKAVARTPQAPRLALTRDAQERMEEMRHLIQQRQGDHAPHGHSRAKSADLGHVPDDTRFDIIDDTVADADRELTRALSNYESLQEDLRLVAAEFKEKMNEYEKMRVELKTTQRQCEVVKKLLADATAEKDILFEAFNEELDAMYNDANLPEDEAWAALCKDLRQTKESRNALTKEKSQLKRALAESQMQKEEWGDLLRSHGLIP